MKTNPLCRIALSGVLAAGLTFSSAGLFAQDAAPPSDAQAQGGQGQWHGQHMTPDEQLERMTKRYKLSADQQSQIKPILADTQQQMMAVRQDNSMSRDDKMTKIQSIRQDSKTKIEAVLNDSQKQQFEADQQRMEQRMQQRMQGAPPAQ